MMNFLSILLVSVGAGTGAMLRYLVSQLFQNRFQSIFPWPTWLINMSGTLILGLVAGSTMMKSQPLWWLFIGPGLCGGFTTFSTMIGETVELLRRHLMIGVVYITTSLGTGLFIAGVIDVIFKN